MLFSLWHFFKNHDVYRVNVFYLSVACPRSLTSMFFEKACQTTIVLGMLGRHGIRTSKSTVEHTLFSLQFVHACSFERDTEIESSQVEVCRHYRLHTDSKIAGDVLMT